MAPIRLPRPLALPGLVLLALACTAAACGPSPTEVRPIERGTALPPPDMFQPARR
jgi:hypothetical protein